MSRKRIAVRVAAAIAFVLAIISALYGFHQIRGVTEQMEPPMQREQLAVVEEKMLPLNEAVDLAVADARVKKENVFTSKVKLEEDEGVYIVEVKFFERGTNNKYHYSIDAYSGAILGRDMDEQGKTFQ